MYNVPHPALFIHSWHTQICVLQPGPLANLQSRSYYKEKVMQSQIILSCLYLFQALPLIVLGQISCHNYSYDRIMLNECL